VRCGGRGTLNCDLDAAMCRRLALVSMGPRIEVVREQGDDELLQGFDEWLRIFVEHAGDDALPVTPGHACFLRRGAGASTRRKGARRPLPEEDLAQGRVAGVADEVRACLDRMAQTRECRAA
jgi:hypothetical protein